MTKTLVSCAIAPLYENVECKSREKRNISLISLLGAKPINKRGFDNTSKIVLVPQPT